MQNAWSQKYYLGVIRSWFVQPYRSAPWTQWLLCKFALVARILWQLKVQYLFLMVCCNLTLKRCNRTFVYTTRIIQDKFSKNEDNRLLHPRAPNSPVLNIIEILRFTLERKVCDHYHRYLNRAIFCLKNGIRYHRELFRLVFINFEKNASCFERQQLSNILLGIFLGCSLFLFKPCIYAVKYVYNDSFLVPRKLLFFNDFFRHSMQNHQKVTRFYIDVYLLPYSNNIIFDLWVQSKIKAHYVDK